MSSRATRSLNVMQAARASVVDKVRRGAGGGPQPRGSGSRGSGTRRPQTQRRTGGGQSRSSSSRATGPAKQQAPSKAGNSPRSTHVVVARLDPLSVLKVSIAFYSALALALLVAAVLLWTAARSAGLVANIEGFLDEIGFTDFRLRTGPLLGAAALASLVLVVAGSVANLLMALLYNVFGDLIGGLKVVLLQDRDTPKR